MAKKKIQYLDTATRTALAELLDWWSKQRVNTPSQSQEAGIGSSQRIFIAYPQEEIPALTDAAGTAPDSPGVALCDIYEIDENDELIEVGRDEYVYNISTGAIAVGWILVVRDGYGKWVAVTGGGGCPSRNEKHAVYILGKPTGGTFDLDYTIAGTTQTISFAYNETAGGFEADLLTHAELTGGTDGDIIVTGGQLPSSPIYIEFTGNYENTAIEIPTLTATSLTGGTGVGVIVASIQQGYPN